LKEAVADERFQVAILLLIFISIIFFIKLIFWHVGYIRPLFFGFAHDNVLMLMMVGSDFVFVLIELTVSSQQ